MIHFHFAEQGAGSSFIHRLDPRTKIVCALLFILAVTVLPAGSWIPYGLLFASTPVVARLAGLGLGFALRRSFVALPFALAAITLPFTLPGERLAQLGPWVISLEGTVRFVSILLKSWISVQMAVLLTATTPFHDLLWALRELRVPRLLVSIVGFMYRYLFVLADEATRLLRARKARSGEGNARSGGGVVWRGRVAGGMVGNLMLRAFERSERIYDAMLARGFKGDVLAVSPPVMGDGDRNVMVLWVTWLAMAVLVGFFFY